MNDFYRLETQNKSGETEWCAYSMGCFAMWVILAMQQVLYGLEITSGTSFTKMDSL